MRNFFRNLLCKFAPFLDAPPQAGQERIVLLVPPVPSFASSTLATLVSILTNLVETGLSFSVVTGKPHIARTFTRSFCDSISWIQSRATFPGILIAFSLFLNVFTRQVAFLCRQSHDSRWPLVLLAHELLLGGFENWSLCFPRTECSSSSCACLWPCPTHLVTATPRSYCLHHAPVIIALHKHRCVVSCSVVQFFSFNAVWNHAPSLSISSILSGVPLFQSLVVWVDLKWTALVNPVHWRHQHRLRVHSIPPATFVCDPVLLVPDPILHAVSLVMVLDQSRSLVLSGFKRCVSIITHSQLHTSASICCSFPFRYSLMVMIYLFTSSFQSFFLIPFCFC